MQKIIDKFGLFSQHLNNAFAHASKKIDRATLQHKFNKLIDAKALFHAALSLDLLIKAKNLNTQKSDH